MKNILPILYFMLVYFAFACSKKTGNNTPAPAPTDCNGVDSRFAAKVSPVILARCATAGCHANGSSNGPGALTNFTQIRNAAADILSAVSSGRMPKGSTLLPQDKDVIICWINSGTPNN